MKRRWMFLFLSVFLVLGMTGSQDQDPTGKKLSNAWEAMHRIPMQFQKDGVAPEPANAAAGPGVYWEYVSIGSYKGVDVDGWVSLPNQGYVGVILAHHKTKQKSVVFKYFPSTNTIEEIGQMDWSEYGQPCRVILHFTKMTDYLQAFVVTTMGKIWQLVDGIGIYPYTATLHDISISSPSNFDNSLWGIDMNSGNRLLCDPYALDAWANAGNLPDDSARLTMMYNGATPMPWVLDKYGDIWENTSIDGNNIRQWTLRSGSGNQRAMDIATPHHKNAPVKQVWIVGPILNNNYYGGYIYRWQPDKNKWQKVNGLAVAIEVTHDNHLLVCNRRGDVWWGTVSE